MMKPGLRLLAAVLLLQSTLSEAHDSRPVFIQVNPDAQGNVLLMWRVPDSVSPADAPWIALSENCGRASADDDGPGFANRRTPEATLQGSNWYRCASPLVPTAVILDWPGAIPSLSTLVRVEQDDGATITRHAGPGEFRILLPASGSSSEVFVQYLVLGVEHILTGHDHLLFVACLVLLAGSIKRIAIAVTGFTLAHSVTLVAAALDVVRLPIPPVETVIALSIVFLAAELARERRDTITWRWPLAVASIFGLLHGFGFAAVLGEIGLPEAESPAALLAFNFGVEVGQLAFVAVWVPLFELIRRGLLRSRNRDELLRYASYPVGVLAVFWTLERLSGFVPVS